MTDVPAPHKKARGRPPKGESDRKNTYLGFRVRDGMREKLTIAAEAGSRSPSEEIERRLIKSFEDEQRIAALEEHINVLRQTEAILYPDDSARALGRTFALALTAARHASGQDWREDSAAPAIIASAMRQMMDRCVRGGRSGAMVAGLFDKARVAATADSIAQTLATSLAEALPPLPPLQPQDDPANWTPRAHTAVTFRDKATGQLLDVVHGPEFDIADPEADRSLGPDYRTAIDRLRPIRDSIDAEDFMVYALADGSTAWERLSDTGPKIHVPAGQDAPPAPEPTARLATPEEVAGTTPARGVLSPELADRALIDDAKSGLPLVQAEREEQDAQRRADRPPAGANVRGRKAKAPA